MYSLFTRHIDMLFTYLFFCLTYLSQCIYLSEYNVCKENIDLSLSLLVSLSHSQEMCDQRLNFTMCPLCDSVCDYWQLSSMCSTARASYLFDNHATVAFAIFMSLWGK